MPKIKLMLTAVMLVIVQSVMAQGQRISGTITDDFGGVMGASVVEVDANNRNVSAAVTDINGNFSMVIKNPKNKLRISYVGAKTVVLPIGSRTNFSTKLGSSSTAIQEVKVTSKRRSNSGGLSIPKREMAQAQQTMDMSQVEGLSFTSADEALQGKIAGLDIVANSGNLGSGTTMRLRGVTSINGNKEPLIVVDDQIFDTPDDFSVEDANEESYASLLSVNVEDIQSITVLKDVASTAIWGSKGANGVIEIKTKRGARGKTRVSYTYKFSGNWQPKGYNLLNGDDYTMLLKEAFYNPTQTSDATSGYYELNYDPSWGDYENWNNNTDWVDAISQFGQSHDHSINLSGGGEKATFRISAGYKYQTGTVIKQSLNQFTTRLALDYFVSERIKFTTNFAFTYLNNNKNDVSDLLGYAQKAAPNMSIYRQDANGNDTGEYYVMDKVTNSSRNRNMQSIYSLGNPVARANLAWAKDNTYRINPDFILQYELLGTSEDKSRLTYRGNVYFDIFSESKPSYYPAELIKESYNNESYNKAYNYELNRMGITVKNELRFTPHFKNEDWTSSMLFRYEMYFGNSNTQNETISQLPTGLTSAIVDARARSASSSSSKSRTQSWIYNGHISYKSRYSLTASIRADGDSKFGPENKWAYFPSASLRWNIIDEPFMKPIQKVVSMLAVRGSWGLSGNSPNTGTDSFYESYVTNGNYGYGSTAFEGKIVENLKLDNLKWELTNGYNIGVNLGLLDDKIEAEFEYYYKKTSDLLMKNVKVASSTGYASLLYANVGDMINEGWELNVNFNNIVKTGKFSLDAYVNVSQNYNELTAMDDKVLDNLNGDWQIKNGIDSYLTRVQVGNPIGSIYGLKYKGVYQYTYDYLTNLKKENNWTNSEFESWINNTFLAEGKTAPIATDANGQVIMNSDGTPKRMVLDNTNNGYKFEGGDAIYEDTNHDGQINAEDLVYLGTSMPKVSGGFGFTFKYGRWKLNTSFNYRFGVKIVNQARMELESMTSAYNQCASVNYRWRKDGDDTPMPRAMYGSTAAYNYLGSDRYVENGSYVRFQYLQLSYSLPDKLLKPIGLRKLSMYVSANNLYCWTKYTGSDPEHSVSGYSYATDNSRTPRSKSFTVGLSVDF